MFIFNLSTDSGTSASTSARSSRSSTLGSGLSTRSATSSESDSETEAVDNVRVVARLVNLHSDVYISSIPWVANCFYREHTLYGNVRPIKNLPEGL